VGLATAGEWQTRSTGEAGGAAFRRLRGLANAIEFDPVDFDALAKGRRRPRTPRPLWSVITDTFLARTGQDFR
jgi:hypothetical protein